MGLVGVGGAQAQAKLAGDASKVGLEESAQVKAERLLLSVGKRFSRPPAALKRIGAKAGRLDKRREAEGLSTDAMVAVGELARAQTALCRAMGPSSVENKDNTAIGQLLGALAGQMELLISDTITPLWSELPMSALRAGKFDFGSLHARLRAALVDHEQALSECKGKFHSGGKDAAKTARVDLVEPYEDALEAALLHGLLQHKRLSRAQQDLELALSGYDKARRGALQRRVAELLRQKLG